MIKKYKLILVNNRIVLKCCGLVECTFLWCLPEMRLQVNYVFLTTEQDIVVFSGRLNVFEPHWICGLNLKKKLQQHSNKTFNKQADTTAWFWKVSSKTRQLIELIEWQPNPGHSWGKQQKLTWVNPTLIPVTCKQAWLETIQNIFMSFQFIKSNSRE